MFKFSLPFPKAMLSTFDSNKYETKTYRFLNEIDDSGKIIGHYKLKNEDGTDIDINNLTEEEMVEWEAKLNG